MTDRIAHPGGIWIVWKPSSVGENLSIDGLILVENHDEIRRLDDLHRKRETGNAGLWPWWQALDSVGVLPKILGALLVHSCGPRQDLVWLEIRRDIDEIARLPHSPDAGQVRIAVNRSRSGRVEFGFAVRRPRRSRGCAVRPLRAERHVHRAQNRPHGPEQKQVGLQTSAHTFLLTPSAAGPLRGLEPLTRGT